MISHAVIACTMVLMPKEIDVTTTLQLNNEENRSKQVENRSKKLKTNVGDDILRD
jgi:hypothetical protein